MIRFISHYFYDLNRNRIHYMTQRERRQLIIVCCITAAAATGVILWILR